MAAGDRSASLAFDTVADVFDARFGGWLSVAAQRRAVRRALLDVFPRGGRLLEIGCGTGEDAAWLSARGFEMHLTDASPAMVLQAQAKLPSARCDVLAAEELDGFAERYRQSGGVPFDGAFSNFAPLNCVEDLSPVARGLALVIRDGGHAVLVLFGTASPGDMIVELLRGRPRQALRRFRAGPAPAQINGRKFSVCYHRRSQIVAAMQPWFRLTRTAGIGIFVPPSAAEPWISRHPRLLAAMERLDRLVERPLSALGDHVLYCFERTDRAL